MAEFNAEKAAAGCVEWIKEFFTGPNEGCNAVIGISGGKDSSIIAGLLCRALGKERVIGVLMPNGVQPDIDVARSVAEFWGIKTYEVNIHDAVEGIKKNIPFELSEQSGINLSPRIRMSTLYAVSQCFNGRVVNTCNLSEDWVGYSTRYGDSAGDFSPCSSFTVTEMKEIGRYLGMPAAFVDKAPSDGLSGKTDEDNLGFTYAELDRYIRTGVIDDPAKKALIDRKHEMNLFKLQLMPAYVYAEE